MAEKPTMLNNIAQTHIRTDMLDTHNVSMAIPSLWEKSYLCPCRNRATRQPNQACKICRGRGIAYLPPRNVNIVIQSQEKGISNADLGLIDSGTAIGTPERGVQIAFRDRITVPTAQVSQSFILDASCRRIEDGFFMVYDVRSIDFATTVDGEIYEGTDFEVDYNNNLFYPKEHLEGKVISLNIQTTLRYMVADLLKEHRYGKQPNGSFEKLPQKLLLKREDIFIDKEAFDVGTNEEEVGQMIDTKRQPTTDGLNGFFRSGGI